LCGLAPILGAWKGIMLSIVIKTLGCLNKYLSSTMHVADSMFIREASLFKGKDTVFLLTWHGIPFKSKRSGCWNGRLNRVVDHVISTSDFATSLLSSFLGVCPSKFRVTGYPRNDKLLSTSRGQARLALQAALGGNGGFDVEAFERIIFYTPTFRHADRVAGVEGAVEGVAVDSLANMPRDRLGDLDRLLRRHDALLVVKYHHYDEFYYERHGLLERLRGMQTGNIRVLLTRDLSRVGGDIYNILPATDALVTDYSSLFYDYLLLDRPILFYMYDLDEYMKTRGLIVGREGLEYYLPGPIARSPAGLLKALEDMIEGIDDYAERRGRLNELVHRFRDPRSSERVWKLIMSKHIPQ
jgi:CDP-glycerol glycerophosphotransferase